MNTWYFSSALPRASMVSMSKWFVGSSRMRKLGRAAPKTAKATRDFWPPERLAMFCRARSPVTPKPPNIRRYSSTGFPLVAKNIFVTLTNKHCITIDTWKSALHQFNWAKWQIKLIDVMLAEVADSQMAAVVPHTGWWVQLSGQNFQECSLTSTVLTNLIKNNVASTLETRETLKAVQLQCRFLNRNQLKGSLLGESHVMSCTKK